LTKLVDGRVQAVFEVDYSVVSPDFLPEFVASDDLMRPIEQGGQELKRLLLEPDAQSVLPDLPRGRVHLEWAEPVPGKNTLHACHGNQAV
jgi:hypothetical protein